MAYKRVISVNESSLVDLKAELYRKETQFKREKVDSSQPKKAPIWQKKKKESKKHAEPAETNKNPSPDSSYNKQLEKSRLMLEAKSALYEKLSKGEIEVPSDEDEQEGRFLVDFHQKTLPKTNDTCSDKEDENNVDQNIPAAASPDEEWVDYVDSFGRSKKCLRKDLPMMEGKDEKSKTNCSQIASIPSLLSDDMRREIVRKKWEKEVEETLDKPVGPVHYQNVLFEESREHGVGYYQFSKTEDERQEQQMTLKKLRVQTEQQRDKREKLLEKRKAAIDARLAKLKERKLRKLKEQGVVGGDEEETAVLEASGREDTKPEADEETSSPKDENEIAVGDFVERIRNKAARIEQSHLNKWEKNKVDLTLFDKPKPKAPTYDPGSERNPEFGPPSFYASASNHGNKSYKTFAKKNEWKRNTKEEHNTTNETSGAWKTDTVSDTQATSPLLTNDASYPQESPSSSNIPQVPVSSYQPPFVGNVLPSLPLPPTHAFPPPAFPPPAFLPSFPPLYPPQFPPSNNNFVNNIPYPPPPPGVYQYPPVENQVNYSLSASTTSTETLPPGPQHYHSSPL